MWPTVFRISLFGREFSLGSFGLLVAIGFLVGVSVGTRLARRYGEDPERDPQRLPDIAMWVLIGVIAGGRLAFVLVNLPYFLERPLEIPAIWKGGLVMYGGLILAFVLGAWKARRLGMNLWHAADWGLTAGFLGQAIGRLGCLMVGDDFGEPTTLPWGLRLPDPLPPDSLFPPELAGQTVHPTQLYMSLKALFLFGLGLWLLRRRRWSGQVACTLLIGYAVLRFLIEFVRGDDAARGGIFQAGLSPAEVGPERAELLLSTSQMIGLALIPLVVVLALRLRRKYPLA
ncbi:MAG: prolipoprotein diacylglyceryl transferase [Planctomycetota bacterium]|nr:MAG: prolipoprotein diacylglyceryl transferase [Planctomycetota bacterium]